MFKYILALCFLTAGTLACADGVIINGRYHNVQRLNDNNYIIDGQHHNVRQFGNGYLDNGEFHNSHKLNDNSYIIDGNFYKFQ